jgi:GNAT superfamily N-acetyltransferase
LPQPDVCQDGQVISDLHLPTSLNSHEGRIGIRRASCDDLDAILALLHDDPVSQSRGDAWEPSDRSRYERALGEIIEDPRNELVVAVDQQSTVVATLQVTTIPGLARRGATRLLVEAVRVAAERRSSGIGSALMRWVMDVATQETGAEMVQLTSDAARADAHRFYLRLGFTDSHVGFKYRTAAEPGTSRD